MPRLFVSKNASARKAFGVPIISIRAGHEAAARESMTGAPIASIWTGRMPEYNTEILFWGIGLPRFFAVELTDGAAGPEQIRRIAGSISISR